MQQEWKISVRQFTVLAMFFTIGTTILIIPAGLAADSKQDAWIAAIVGVLLGALLVWFYNGLARQFPGMTFTQFLEKAAGKWLGKAIALGYVFFSFIGAATVLFYVGNFITTQVMPETPIQWINLLFMSIVVMGLRLGIETIARAAEIFFPWFVVLYTLLVIFISPQIEWQQLQPVLETGIKPLLKGAVSLVGTATLTFVVLLMIYPMHLNRPDKARKGFMQAALIGGLFMIVITFLCIAVLGPETVARNAYPSYSLAKKISVGNFIERIEAVMAALWFLTIYFKLTLYAYASIAGLAQVLQLRDYRPITLPFGMLVVVYSLIVYPNTSYMAKWDTTTFIPYVITFGLVLPSIVWAVAKLRKQSG